MAIEALARRRRVMRGHTRRLCASICRHSTDHVRKLRAACARRARTVAGTGADARPQPAGNGAAIARRSARPSSSETWVHMAMRLLKRLRTAALVAQPRTCGRGGAKRNGAAAEARGATPRRPSSVACAAGRGRCGSARARGREPVWRRWRARLVRTGAGDAAPRGDRHRDNCSPLHGKDVVSRDRRGGAVCVQRRERGVQARRRYAEAKGAAVVLETTARHERYAARSYGALRVGAGGGGADARPGRAAKEKRRGAAAGAPRRRSCRRTRARAGRRSVWKSKCHQQGDGRCGDATPSTRGLLDG